MCKSMLGLHNCDGWHTFAKSENHNDLVKGLTLTRHYTWCQQLPKFADKPGHWSFVPPFLSPASSAFLPHSERLSRKELSKKACRLERAPCGPAASPTTLTCMLSCIRAWPAFIRVSLQQPSPIRDIPAHACFRSLTQQ